MRQHSPVTRSPSNLNGSDFIVPVYTRPRASVNKSLKPGASSRANRIRVAPSFTWQMFLPEITTPPSAWSAIPPTPRRLGTTVSIVPSGRRRNTPPLVTSLKYRFPAPSARGPSISPYP